MATSSQDPSSTSSENNCAPSENANNSTFSENNSTSFGNSSITSENNSTPLEISAEGSQPVHEQITENRRVTHLGTTYSNLETPSELQHIKTREHFSFLKDHHFADNINYIHSRLKPTHATIYDRNSGLVYGWSSRGHRKLRAAPVIGHDDPETTLEFVNSSDKDKAHAFNTPIHLFSYEPNILSWYVGWLVNLANCFWIVNGVFAFWPDLASPLTTNRILYATGIVGILLFNLSSFLGVLEVIHQSASEINHGVDVERREANGNLILIRRSNNSNSNDNENGNNIISDKATDNRKSVQKRHHLIHWKSFFSLGDEEEKQSIAYIASVIFMISTFIYLIPMVVWYPLYKANCGYTITVILVWVLEAIASLGFMIFGYLFMVEASGSWYRPVNTLGYWSSLFNLVGAFGFFLCGIFGIPDGSEDLYRYGSALSTFWGSIFFCIAGWLQWIEFCNAHALRFWLGDALKGDFIKHSMLASKEKKIVELEMS